MTHYYSSKKEQMGWKKAVPLAIVILALIVTYLHFVSKHDEQIMDIKYCWDSNGEHYIAPNSACTQLAFN